MTQDALRLANDLERLCCAETEGQFFDLVTDSIGTIVAALRETEHLRAVNEDMLTALNEIKVIAAYHLATRVFRPSIARAAEAKK